MSEGAYYFIPERPEPVELGAFLVKAAEEVR